MPINAIILALAAGCISAIVFASATTGALPLRLVLFFLTPLPLYLAGLNLGPAGVALAAAAATIILVQLASPIGGLVFAASTAIPAFVLSRLALLSRDTSEGDGGDSAPEWYPVGRLVATAAALGGAFTLIAMLVLGSAGEGLVEAIQKVVEAFAKSELPQMPGAPELTPAQIKEIAETTLKTLPWVLGMLTTLTMLLNLWLAGRITVASGRLVRPWPQLSAIRLPMSVTYVFLAAVGMTTVGGGMGLAGSGFGGAFMFAFMLVGLAAAHALSEGAPWRTFALTGLYAALFVLSAPTMLLLAIAGIAETVFNYRAVSAPTPPENPN